MKYFLLLLALVASDVIVSQNSQQEIDSLMIVAETANDSVRFRIKNKAAFFYIFNEPEKAKRLLDSSLSDPIIESHPFSKAELTNTFGIYYAVTGQSDSAKINYENALAISRNHSFDRITRMIINNLGMNQWNSGNFQVALEYFFQALEMAKKTAVDDKGFGVYYNNIGLIYQEMYQWDKAIEYHDKSLTIREKHQLLNEIPASQNNLAICYKELGLYEKAEELALESLANAKEAKTFQYEVSALSTLGNTYVLLKKYPEAIKSHKLALERRASLGIDENDGLGSIIGIIESYNRLGQPKLAKPYFERGQELILEYPELNYDGNFNMVAAEMFFRLNQPNKGSYHISKSFAARDSLFSSENATALANLETKFKVAENERDLAKTRANLAETELKVKNRNNIITGSLGLAVILGLIGFLFYNQQKLRNQQLQKEGELKAALARIETQNKLQEQRLRISRDLHDNIGSQLTFVTSSVDNLKFGLKEADENVTSKLSKISEFTTQTIYELRDTIWAMNKTEITFEDLQTRIANFIDQAGAAAEGVDFNFEVSKLVKADHIFSSVEGMNIYRIIQEAVNNALKYAKPSTILVGIMSSDEGYKVEIIDNGSGFDITTIEKGNGIHNMTKRAKDIGGSVSINSKPDVGTKITLLVK